MTSWLTSGTSHSTTISPRATSSPPRPSTTSRALAEYVRLLASAIAEAEASIQEDIALAQEEAAPRRADALRIVAFKLQAAEAAGAHRGQPADPERSANAPAPAVGGATPAPLTRVVGPSRTYSYSKDRPFACVAAANRITTDRTGARRSLAALATGHLTAEMSLKTSCPGSAAHRACSCTRAALLLSHVNRALIEPQ